MHYYQKNIKDWVVATAHLTPEEEGVYNRLIDYYYDTESPIPEETDSVIRRLRLRGYEETVALILEEFFVLEDGLWRHQRCDLEIEAYCERAERARKNGRKGGRPPKDKGSESPESSAPKPSDNPKETQSVSGENPEQTQAKAPNNQYPITNTQQPTKTYASFDEFWALYPKKVNRSKTKAKWDKLKVTDDLFNQIAENIRARLAAGEWRESEKKFIPDPLTYLNGKRWEDEIIPPVVPNSHGPPRPAYQTAQQLRAQRDEETFDYERMTSF